MPVVAVGRVIPKQSRVLTKKLSHDIPKPEPKGFINSFEFQAGFYPDKIGYHKNDPVKVQHYIDAIV